jgi:hypothetical protein
MARKNAKLKEHEARKAARVRAWTTAPKRTPGQQRFLEWAEEFEGRKLSEQEQNLWVDQAEALDGPL